MSKQDAPDIFVSGLDHVELIGNGLARFVMFANAPGENGEDARRFVSLVMPVSEVPDAVRKTMVVPTAQILYGSIYRILPLWLH